MKQIVQHEGLMLEIQYDPDPSLGMSEKLGPLINSARVLDSDYKPTGPNLVCFLDKCFFQIAENEASKFLSLVANELA